MNLATPNILVVDDKEDAGLKIVRALWEGGFAPRFIRYDGRILKKITREKSAMRGIRVVFMDINLISGAMGADAQNFSAIQHVLETVLSEDNGPYLLVTWSSHDDYADRLFQHLDNRLALNRRPIATKRLSKTDFEGKNATRLPAEVKRILSEVGFAGCLIGWESLIRDAGIATVNRINKLAFSLPDEGYRDRNQKLGAIIRSFAEAEAADHINLDSAFPALASVLAHVLHDDAFSMTKPLATHHGPSIMEMARTTDSGTRAKIHQALHVEYGGLNNRGPAPGDVFVYPVKNKTKRGGLPILDFSDFIPEQFFELSKWSKLDEEAKKPIIAATRIILVEITPPCDHANLKKLVWHRYVLGIESNQLAASYLKKKADYLHQLPSFSSPSGDELTIILNSRATASVPPAEANALGKRLYRLRAQMLSEIIRWVSGQQARLGYIQL